MRFSVSTICLLASAALCGSSLSFTYLDLVDPSIRFEPVFFQNEAHRKDFSYSIITQDEELPQVIPGYEGRRCIVEVELAQALHRVQEKLVAQNLCLKVYDAYRPQQAVDYFTKWTEWEDTPLAKKHHYPQVQKKDLDALSYLSRTSSHAKGTAVDVTLCPLTPSLEREISEDFLGIWDAESLDMGVGYLCFDQRSWHSFNLLSDEQKQARQLLCQVMQEEGFTMLETEFWHYYYQPERNPDTPYFFPIRDDYAFTPAAP